MSSTDALKKPQSAYFLWFNANREKIQNIVGTKALKVVGAKGGELWQKASSEEKLPFEEEVKRQKAAYDAFVASEDGQKALQAKKAEKKEEKQAKLDKEAERAKLKQEKQIAREKRQCNAAVKAVEKDEKLKKPMTSYFMWLTDNREKIARVVGSKGSEVARKASEMWKKLTDTEKKPYEDRAKKEKEEYDAYRATPEGAAALLAYKEAKSAVAYKEKVDEDEKSKEADADVKEAEVDEDAGEEKVIKKQKKITPEKALKRAQPDEAGETPPAKRGRGRKAAATPKDVEIDAAVLKEAESLSMASQFKNLAARADVMSSGKSQKDMLDALKNSDGLVNKAKCLLLAGA